ncbi:Coronin-2A [Toxocara canis]|uniref:Coronin n=1 Tax=Toxocara canis TaxID=6265 RepID=A0A0B2VE98_TOXCA|nr:Coronin-2A [Toxocara canis]
MRKKSVRNLYTAGNNPTELELTVGGELVPKLKHSRFRHVFAKSVRRSEWYDTGPGYAVAVAANPKMIALSVDVPAGGVVQVAKLCTMGRGHMQMAKIKDHQGVVCDAKWNPFNDNVLATASHDATVRIWHVDDMLRIRCLRISRAHSRRVNLVEWHTTVDNALFSAAVDGRIVLWNIETDELVYVIDDCHATSLSLSYNCCEFAVTTRSRELIVFNARSGLKEREAELVHDGTMLPRVLYSGNRAHDERIVTTGTCRSTRRQIAIHDSLHLETPLAVVDIDGGSGLLMPIIDNDLNLLYIAGKGDANIRLYELSSETPFISYLNESCGHKAHTAVCALPKRALSVSQCEIMRIFRVDATQLVIEPLSFIVPRRADCFQADLFPATRSPTPSLTFREWLAGLDREPILIELKDCVLNCTNKPVTFCKESAQRAPKLITADINNDRKFRFLSQVTKADYREVNEREDREELLKMERIKAKIAAEGAAEEVLKEHSFESGRSETNALIGGERDVHESSLRVGDAVATMNHKNSSIQQPSVAPTRLLDGHSLIIDKSSSSRTWHKPSVELDVLILQGVLLFSV